MNISTPVEEDIQAFVSTLRQQDCDYIRNLPEEKLILLYRTLGLTLRNAFRTGTYMYLFTHCDKLETPQTRSFDSISSTAIKLVWEHLRHD